MFRLLATDMTMGSWPHIVSVLFYLGIAVGLFFGRKFFMKNKIADFVVRMVLGFILVWSEFQTRFNTTCLHSSAPVVLRNLPIPLCGMLLWIAAIAIIADSERIIRKFYPILLTAATLSLIVCDLPGQAYPDFRCFQYFFCHGGFLLATLYMVFTRKLNKITWKDYGWSCLIIGTMGGIMSFLFAANPKVFPDDFYVMGWGLFSDIREAVGQIPFSLIYMSAVAGIMALFTWVTILLTKKRPERGNEPDYYKPNKFYDFIAHKLTKNGRTAIITGLIIAMLFFLAWQGVMSGYDYVTGGQIDATRHDPVILGLGWFIGVLWMLTLVACILNEIAVNYLRFEEIQQERIEEKQIRKYATGNRLKDKRLL